MKHNIRIVCTVGILLLAALACNLPGSAATPPPAAPVVDATKISLEIQSTQMSLQLTQSALEPTKTEQPTQPPPPSTQPPVEQPAAVQATAIPPTEIPPTPAPDMDKLIKSAKILVYEDAGGARLGEWVKGTLDLMGLKYVHDGDRIGDFMSHLNSSTQWDLIIVAAESRSGVQGEFWDVITPKVTSDKAALIVEMWYLSKIANGRIQSLTAKCGIEFQKTRNYVDSIYTLDSANPVFSTPNSGFSLVNYIGHWDDKGGDYVRLSGGGDASLVAGGFLKEKSRYGLLTTCMDGRVVIQTFSSHDYHREVMQLLWENYITTTLTNHFLALEK
jgi:hypothetical protein